jgi:hypothetical protein
VTGNDVTELQKFLILENEGPAARALKIHGTTKNFATLTFAALKEFQSAVGITPASGYFGPITRAHVNAAKPDRNREANRRPSVTSLPAMKGSDIIRVTTFTE